MGIKVAPPLKVDFNKYYEATTQACDDGFGYLGTLMDRVLRTEIFKDCKNILDLGCGTGFWTKVLKDHGYNVVGCDINNSQCEEVIVTDMHQMSFKDKEFDGVFCNGVFEHSLAPYILLHEISRILSVGGIFYVNMPDISNYRCLSLPQHINTQCFNNMVNLCKKVGFEILDYAVLPTKLAGLHQYFVFKKMRDIK